MKIRNGFQEGEQVFASFYNDDNTIQTGFFKLIRFSDTFIILGSEKSEIMIPMIRILKIKRKLAVKTI